MIAVVFMAHTPGQQLLPRASVYDGAEIKRGIYVQRGSRNEQSQMSASLSTQCTDRGGHEPRWPADP